MDKKKLSQSETEQSQSADWDKRQPLSAPPDRQVEKAIRQFSQTFPIRYALRTELSRSHYRMLMCVEEAGHCDFYLSESADSGQGR